jgi:hypothetical protein
MGLSLHSRLEWQVASSLTFTVNKMKKLQYKVKPPLSEELQKYGCFQNFPPAKTVPVIQFLVTSL